jgi:hypothetical protein
MFVTVSLENRAELIFSFKPQTGSIQQTQRYASAGRLFSPPTALNSHTHHFSLHTDVLIIFFGLTLMPKNCILCMTCFCALHNTQIKK